MSTRSPLRSVSVILALVMTVAACGPAASPSTSPVSPSPFASASTAPMPSVASSPSPSSSSAIEPSSAACPTFLLRDIRVEDRLVGVSITPGAGVDRVRFSLAASTPTSPGGPSVAEVSPSAGPFVADPSGQPLAVAGSRFVVVRFRGMSLADPSGTPVYTGPASFSEPGPGIRAVVRQAAYEGVTTWIVGYDGTACATADHSDVAITIVVLHG